MRGFEASLVIESVLKSGIRAEAYSVAPRIWIRLLLVKPRSTVAALLAFTWLTQTPLSARAQERPSAPVQLVVPAPASIDLRMNGAWSASSLSSAPGVPWLSANPAPIKLSKGAITAIVIGGVILVVLVVAGVAVIGKPGKVH